MVSPLQNEQVRENIVGLGLVLITLGNSVYETKTVGFPLSGSTAHVLLGMWILAGYLFAATALVSVLADHDGFGYATGGFYFVTLAVLTLFDYGVGHWVRVGTAAVYAGVALVAYGSYLLAEKRPVR